LLLHSEDAAETDAVDDLLLEFLPPHSPEVNTLEKLLAVIEKA
jgi:transposase